jgi:ABC-type sugar transport system, periplasmic component
MRKLGILSILLSLLIMLAACSSGNSANNGNGTPANDSGSPGEKVSLRMSIVAGADEMPAWQGIVDGFNQSHPSIEVKLERLPGSWNEYIQKMTAQIAAGNPPDIGRMGVAYMPMFSSKGQLEDLAPYTADMNMGDYYDSAMNQYLQDGKMFGMPIGVYTMAMYYNKDMFEKAGIPLPPADWNKAWTFEDLRDAAQKLTSGSGAGKQYGIYANLNPERAIPYLWSSGGGLISDDKTQSVIQTAESKNALSFLQGLIKEGYSPTPAETQTTPPDQLFLSGKLGMLVEGQWMMPSFSKINNFKWGVAPIAVGDTGKAVTANFVDAYVVFKGSKHVKEAAEVLKYFVSEEAENIMVDHNIGGIPVLKSVAEARKADMFNPLLPEEKEVWLQSVEVSRSLPFTSNWQELMNTAMKKLDLVGLNELEADKAADQLAPEFEKLLQQQ